MFRKNATRRTNRLPNTNKVVGHHSPSRHLFVWHCETHGAGGAAACSHESLSFIDVWCWWPPWVPCAPVLLLLYKAGEPLDWNGRQIYELQHAYSNNRTAEEPNPRLLCPSYWGVFDSQYSKSVETGNMQDCDRNRKQRIGELRNYVNLRLVRKNRKTK